MIIDSVRIKHFRCLRDLEIGFRPLTVLLGRNGAGKSCVLHALDTFYKLSANISEEDFYARDLETPIEITITFGQLRTDELIEFAAYISNSRLTVTKRIVSECGRFSQRYSAAPQQYRRFAEIRALQRAMPKRTSWNGFVASGEFPGLLRATSVAQVDEYMTAFEEAHQDLLESVEQEVQFFGPPNVGGGKLDNYTKFVLVPAVKDVTDELDARRGSSLSQLLDIIVLRRIEGRDDITHRRTEIEAQIRDLLDASNLPELRELGTEISALLGRFFPGAELVLDWAEVEVPSIDLPTASSRLVEDDFEGDIDKKGHGLQRALLITLLQYLAQIPREELTYSSQGPDDDAPTGSKPVAHTARPSLILAIEEPELYLHPLRCKYLASLFSDLTRFDDHQSVQRNQIICSSHSPHFVDLRNFEDIRILRKARPPGLPAAESRCHSFPIQAARQRLATIAHRDPEDVTEQSFKAHIIPVMSSMANEGFFADLVVLVEGYGDAGILAKLQDLLHKDWINLGVAIVPIEGKTKLDRPALIFQGFGIPTYLIFDGDGQIQGTPKDSEKERDKNRRLLRLLNSPEEDYPKTQVHSRWAVFENDIEDELRNELGEDTYMSLRENVANEFGFDRPSQVTKSYHCCTRFVELAYEQGNHIPILEEIVHAITDLASSTCLWTNSLSTTTFPQRCDIPPDDA